MEAMSSTGAAAPAAATGQLFARQSSGLVRGWSIWDAFRYAFFCVNPIVLGFWAFSLAPFIGTGSMFWAAIITTGLMLLAVVTYAVLITVLPRAGGDYLYQTRILGGGIGFVVTCAGIWFIMAHWAPIYAQVVVNQLLEPLSTLAGLDSVATWWATKDGIFVASLITILVATILVAMGMRRLARVQIISFWGGVIGIAILFVLLLVNGKGDFISAYNSGAADYYGASGNAYEATLNAGAFDPAGFGFPVGDTLLLVPLLLFWNVYIIWGAALTGEVRGVADFRKNLLALGGALIVALIVTLVFFGLAAKTMGWEWYNSANSAYWGSVYGTVTDAPVGAFPYPVMLGSWLIDSSLIQFVIVAITGLFIVGFVGTLFLTPTRMIFAAAFDRVLPEWAAKVSFGGVPVGALVLMIVPSVIMSALYAYTDNFAEYTLDAVLVLTSAFLFSAIALMLLPYKAKQMFEATPFARWRVGGIPTVTLVGLGLAVFFGACIVAWLVDDRYGVNNSTSLIYMGCLYVVALLIYVTARAVRAQQGVPLVEAQKEIPAD
jgi:amino acid transporter